MPNWLDFSMPSIDILFLSINCYSLLFCIRV
jgi:hypothetical protein